MATLAELDQQIAETEAAISAVKKGQKKGIRGRMLEYPPLDVLKKTLAEEKAERASLLRASRPSSTYISRRRI